MLFGCSGLLIAAAAFITEIPPQVRSALVCSEDTSGVFVQEKRMCGKDGVLSEKKFTTEGRYRIRPGVDFVWETEKPFKSRFYATTEKYVYSNEDETVERMLADLHVPIDAAALAKGDFSVFFEMFDVLYKEENGRFFLKAKPKPARLKSVLVWVEAEGVKGDWKLSVRFASGDEMRVKFRDGPRNVQP